MNTAIPEIPGSLSVTENAASRPKDLSAQEDDTRVEKAGGSVVIGPMSVQYLVGAEIDHQEGLGARNLYSTIPTRGPRAGAGGVIFEWHSHPDHLAQSSETGPALRWPS